MTIVLTLSELADKIVKAMEMDGCNATVEWLLDWHLNGYAKWGANNEDIAGALRIAIERLRQHAKAKSDQANTLETFLAKAVKDLGIERKA